MSTLMNYTSPTPTSSEAKGNRNTQHFIAGGKAALVTRVRWRSSPGPT
jgi:hypothetical protein